MPKDPNLVPTEVYEAAVIAAHDADCGDSQCADRSTYEPYRAIATAVADVVWRLACPADGRAVCPVCGGRFKTTKAGWMRDHLGQEYTSDRWRKQCAGVGRPPRS